MKEKSKIIIHSEEMSLLGEKLGLIKIQSRINKEIEKINKKLEQIASQKVLNILKDKEDIW
tara:strand:+ start:499 stop:681 length:183 start_codon:yes stop_codon:yes gene_type:complete